MNDGATPNSLGSEQHHTIPNWFLKNFADSDGMLHVARKKPRVFFRSKPESAFRRRDYYAAKQIGHSLEVQTARLDSRAAQHVRNILGVARKGIEKADLRSRIGTISEDVQVCGVFISHLGYRSPQWMGENFFSGADALQLHAERTGKDMTALMDEANTELIQSGEFILVFSEMGAPQFIVGDCGPFVSGDTELGIDNEKRKMNDPNWTPAEERMWMALSPDVALGVALRKADTTLNVSVLSHTASNTDWVDHFNEICARHSEMIAGPCEEWIREASQNGWPNC